MNAMRSIRSTARAPVVLALTLASFLCADDVLAQTRAALEAGTRIRVTAPNRGLHRAKAWVGDLTRGDSLVVHTEEAGGDAVRLAWSDVSELDVAVDRGSHAGAGLAIGAVAGVVVGFGVGFAEGDDPPDIGFFKGPTFSAAQKGAVLGLALGVLGGLAGYGIGSLVSTEGWEPVDSSGFTATLTPTPASGGLSLGLLLSWAPW